MYTVKKLHLGQHKQGGWIVPPGFAVVDKSGQVHVGTNGISDLECYSIFNLKHVAQAQADYLNKEIQEMQDAAYDAGISYGSNN